MIYQNINDMVRSHRTFTCIDCGAQFPGEARYHPLRCPACREAIRRERKKVIDHNAYMRRTRTEGMARPAHPLDALAIAVIKCAVMDATCRTGYDDQPVSQKQHDEAVLWMKSTGREWLETYGWSIHRWEKTLEVK